MTHECTPGAWRPGAERRRREPRASGRLPRQPAARGGRGGGEDWGGGAGPPPLHRTHLWNVLALTEQRRRRAQATLGPSARPPRQAAPLIGLRRARTRSPVGDLIPGPQDHALIGIQGLRICFPYATNFFHNQPLCILPAAEQDIRDADGPPQVLYPLVHLLCFMHGDTSTSLCGPARGVMIRKPQSGFSTCQAAGSFFFFFF
ncbi:unnamed protein product [Nyctereutes procyonoides]|uniref:(raccoon dog) hypothetical protein n=1 Tax=Nyctereutes procyonoides TaxID=34880 RepID=A0A811ZIM2_NYCPR|nr:unnamed protein product [Nyctereutes procyonoides]